VHSKKSLIQQKFHKKLYHFNRNSQFRSVMKKMIQLGIRSRTKKSDSDSLGIRLRNADFNVANITKIRRNQQQFERIFPFKFFLLVLVPNSKNRHQGTTMPRWISCRKFRSRTKSVAVCICTLEVADEQAAQFEKTQSSQKVSSS